MIRWIEHATRPREGLSCSFGIKIDNGLACHGHVNVGCRGHVHGHSKAGPVKFRSGGLWLATASAASVVSAVRDKISQVVTVDQVDDIDEVHQRFPMHQRDHKDELAGHCHVHAHGQRKDCLGKFGPDFGLSSGVTRQNGNDTGKIGMAAGQGRHAQIENCFLLAGRGHGHGHGQPKTMAGQLRVTIGSP